MTLHTGGRLGAASRQNRDPRTAGVDCIFTPAAQASIEYGGTDAKFIAISPACMCGVAASTTTFLHPAALQNAHLDDVECSAPSTLGRVVGRSMDWSLW